MRNGCPAWWCLASAVRWIRCLGRVVSRHPPHPSCSRVSMVESSVPLLHCTRSVKLSISGDCTKKSGCNWPVNGVLLIRHARGYVGMKEAGECKTDGRCRRCRWWERMEEIRFHYQLCICAHILPGSLPAFSQPGVDHGPRQLACPLCLMTPGLLCT